MKRTIFAVPVLCLILLYGCDSDRRTAQEEGYEAPEESTELTHEYPDVDSEQEVHMENTSAAGVQDEAVDFIKEAAKGSMLEVELAQLALKKARAQEVKEFAEMLANEHKQVNERLKAIAQQKNFVLPETLEGIYQEKATKLSELNGSEFDQEYLNMIAEIHDETIDNFEDMEDEILDPELQQWAETTIPVLRQHYEQAQQLQEQLNEENQ